MKLIDRLVEEVSGPPLFRVATRYADKAGGPPPVDELIAALVTAGYRACRTHFDPAGVRTDAPPSEMRRAVAEIERVKQKEKADKAKGV